MGSLYCGTNYFDVDQWLLCFVRFKFVDVAHGFDPPDYSAEDCVLVVKPGCCHDGNEELRAVCIWATISHRQHIGSIESMLLGTELILEIPAPDRLPASSVPLWAPGLVHKILNHPMENNIIVIPFPAQLNEIFACLGAILAKQL